MQKIVTSSLEVAQKHHRTVVAGRLCIQRVRLLSWYTGMQHFRHKHLNVNDTFANYSVNIFFVS